MFLARNGPELYVSSSTYFTWFSRLYSIHNRGAGGTGRRRPGKRAKTRYRHRQIRPISVPYDVPITVPSPNLRHRHPDKFTSSSIALSANGPFYTEVYRACVPLVNAPGLQEHVGINYRADSRNNSANLNGSGRMEAQVRRLARAFVHSLDVPLRNFSKRFDERIEKGKGGTKESLEWRFYGPATSLFDVETSRTGTKVVGEKHLCPLENTR